jgi:hypothetical protein
VTRRRPGKTRERQSAGLARLEVRPGVSARFGMASVVAHPRPGPALVPKWAG